MSHIATWFFYWLGVCVFVLLIYIGAATGRLYCAAMFIGHTWAIVKEEIGRSWRVIIRALNRKDVQ